MRRLRFGLLAVGVVASLAGCDNPFAKKGTTASETGSGIKVIDQTKQAVQRTVDANELKNLHLFIDTASLASGHMPTAAEITTVVRKEDKRLADAIADGTIILTGATTRESLWAYSKDAGTKGGWIVTNNGPEQVDAATAQRWINGR